MPKKPTPKQTELFDLSSIPVLTKEQFKESLKQEFIQSKAPAIVPQKPLRGDRFIYYRENERPLQLAMDSGSFKPYPKWAFPPIGGETEVIQLLYSSNRIGIDFEFYPGTLKPSIIGVASPTHAAACRWKGEIGAVTKALQDAVSRGATFVGHFVLGADKLVLEKSLGIETPYTQWDDSMIRHYLCFAALTKAPGKTESEGALGFMNLGSAAHLWLGIPNWKSCRGNHCTGPCPKCRVFDYCAVDAWAGLRIADLAIADMQQKGIPERVYEEHAEIAWEFCLTSEKHGIKVDVTNLEAVDKEIETKKEALFPKDEGGNYHKFNPKSNIQVVEYFNKNGVKLKDNRKQTILDLCTIIADDYGYETLKDFIEVPPENRPELTLIEQDLLDLFMFKDSGKGIDPWFGPKYLRNGFIHPRFNFTGASTMRFSSSGPNYQNIGAHGWGAALKRLIIPRAKEKKLLSADACVAPDTKILLADLSWIRAEQLQVGDKVVGFDEELKNHKNRFRKTEVERLEKIWRSRYKIITTEGTIVVAADHPFVALRKDTSGGDKCRTWVLAKDLKEGEELAFTTKPWEQNHSYEAGWLAGFLDGDGWIWEKRGIGLSQKEGTIVEKKLEDKLTAAGYNKFCKYSYTPSKIEKNGKLYWNPEQAMISYVNSDMWECLRFCGEIRPIKAFPKAETLWNGIRTWGKNTIRAKILKIEYMGTGYVMAIQTGTKTYISEGFMSHNSNLELRTVLHESGIDVGHVGDAFKWLVEQSSGAFKSPAEELGKTERDLAKIASHASDYLLGLALLTKDQLMESRTKSAIAQGALVVFEDWIYHGFIVGFTGSKLAQMLYKDKTYASRKKVLEIQKIYFDNFPSIREWHRKILRQAELGFVQTCWGDYLELIDEPHKNAKVAAAKIGQGLGAVYVQGKMLEYLRKYPNFKSEVNMIGQVHDEIIWEIPYDWDDLTIVKFCDILYKESHRIPGFKCPWSIKVGDNWGTMQKLNREEILKGIN